MSAELSVEASGETVGEAKWLALRELEGLHPGLDKATVRFQVVSEGERGLLGVGYSPARVVATCDRADDAGSPSAATGGAEGELALDVREIVERIAAGIGVQCRVEMSEEDETLIASCQGADLGLLIGKHGSTIDAIQYLVNSVVRRGGTFDKAVVVDAAGYRERRRATLESLALRSAEQALADGRTVRLEPMSAPERKVVHLRLQDLPGVETRSDGAEPSRYVLVVPTGE